MDLVNQPGSPLLGGAMETDEERDAALTTAVTLAAKDGAWKDALSAAEQEVRRAVEHGFTAAELKTQVTDMSGALHAAAEQEDTRTNQSLANAVLGRPAEVKAVLVSRKDDVALALRAMAETR